MILLSLFALSFLAATIFPLGSEAALSGAIVAGQPLWLCVAVATVGNSLGSIFTYYLGRLGKTEWIERYLKVSHDKVLHMKQRIEKYGACASFLIFVPVVGDVMALALGYMRYPAIRYVPIMTAGKIARYLVWAFLHTSVQKAIS